jgi:hypothetical protein
MFSLLRTRKDAASYSRSSGRNYPSRNLTRSCRQPSGSSTLRMAGPRANAILHSLPTYHAMWSAVRKTSSGSDSNWGSSSKKSCLYSIGNTLPEYRPAPAWEDNMGWSSSRRPGAEPAGSTCERWRQGCVLRSHAIVQMHTPMKGVKHCKMREGWIPRPWSACLVRGFRVSQISGEPHRDRVLVLTANLGCCVSLCHHRDLFCRSERTCSRLFAYSRVFGFPRIVQGK